MRRIAKNSCGFSGYTCIGIPRLMYLGMYKDLVAVDIQRTNPSLSSVISVRSWLSSCDLGTPDPVQGFSECPESPTNTAYIWYNFGLLPTEICIYDKTAKASDLSLSLGLTELCLWTYDRYSHLYVSVALQIGGSVLVSDCYVKEQQNNVYKRVQHYPGILDPAHPIPDITVPDIYVPTLAPLVSVAIPLMPDTDVSPVAFQAITAGNMAVAAATAGQDQCASYFATSAAIKEYDESAGTTYTIGTAEGVFYILGIDGSVLGYGFVDAVTWLVKVKPGASATVYCVCVLTRPDKLTTDDAEPFDASLALRSELKSDLTLGEVLVPVAIITMGCVPDTLYINRFDKLSANTNDPFKIEIEIDTAWLQLAFNDYSKAMKAIPTDKCAANIKQLVCGPIKLGIELFRKHQPIVSYDLDAGAAAVVNTWFGPTSMSISVTGILDLLGATQSRFVIAKTSPDSVSLLFAGAPLSTGIHLPHINNGTFTWCTMRSSGLIVNTDTGLAVLSPPDYTGSYVLCFVGGKLTWLPLAVGLAPTWPDWFYI